MSTTPTTAFHHATAPTSDVLPVVRARLANGKHIADADIVRLCDEIDHLRALIKSIARHGT